MEIPASALDAIRTLAPAGHTVVVATGRIYEHAKPFIDLVKPSYAITLNGARIYRGGLEVHNEPLNRAAVIALFDWIAARGYDFGTNRGVVGHLSAITPMTQVPLDAVGIAYELDRKEYLVEDIYQAWLFFDESLDATLAPEIVACYPQFEIVRWHKNAVDVMPSGVNKWTGCQWVLTQTGFLAEQAIAFGDALNDIEMLQGVGLGVAMGNGHPELKAIANHIAPALHLDRSRPLEELALI